MSDEHKLGDSVFTGHSRDLTSIQESGFTNWRAGIHIRQTVLIACQRYNLCCLTV